MLILVFAAIPVYAADILADNYSFESNLTGWTPRFDVDKEKHEQKALEKDCTGQITASNEQAYTGTHSAKLAGSPKCHNLGLESASKPIQQGETMIAYIRAYMEGREAQLQLRFYDAAGQLLHTEVTTSESPDNQWTTLKVKADAPANTASYTAMLYSEHSNKGTVYFDDLLLTTTLTDLGVQITNSTIHSATFGKDEKGNESVFVVVDGVVGDASIPAKIVAVDLTTGKTMHQAALVGASGGWAATTASDGTVYVGSYSNGHLYQYKPGSDTAVDLGQAVAGEAYVWDLAAGDNGSVYGGTSNNAAVFKYEPGKGISKIGDNPVVPKEAYVRSIGYDPVHKDIYAGIGSHAALIRINETTGEKVDLLPQAYKSESFTYNIDIRGSKMFVRVLRTYKTLVYDLNDRGASGPEAVIDLVHSIGITPVRDNKIYYVANNKIYSYDLTAKTTAEIGVNIPATPQRMSIAKLSDQVNWPGDTLVAALNSSKSPRLFKYNFQTGKTSYEDILVSGVPNLIRSLLDGPDGKIYTTGYLVGGAGVYTPLRSDLSYEYNGVGQSENMTKLGTDIYFGVYPGARISRFDTTQPLGPNNPPQQVFELGSSQQDRPFGMATGEGKLFVGTQPDYGKLEGAFTVYDPVTASKTVYKNIVPNQSIIALAYKDKVVYGGSTVWGGAGIDPVTSDPKMFKFHTDTGQTELVDLPVSGLKAITDLQVGPDGNIWGFAEGYFFIYNTKTSTFDTFEHTFPDVVYPPPVAQSGVNRDAKMLIGQGGHMYGTIHGRLFKIDKDSHQVTVLLENAGSYLAKDEFGNLYFTVNSRLLRYAF